MLVAHPEMGFDRERNGGARDFKDATSGDELRQPTTTEPMSRPVAAEARIVELLERENEFLRDQVKVKDKQIAEQQERAHETNALINGLQRLLAPLLAAPDRERSRPAGEV
jgi:hypothetical protein